MANILIWGKTRELLPAIFPSASPPKRSTPWPPCRPALETQSSTLILTEPGASTRERAALEAWVKAGAAGGAP